MQSNAVAVKLNIVTYDLKEEIEKIIKNYEIMEKTKNYKFEVVLPEKIVVKADKEDIPYIWDKYYKKEANKNHQREYIGSGIGLSIVKEILEKHGFKYGVNSQKNKGTTFYFNIKK